MLYSWPETKPKSTKRKYAFAFALPIKAGKKKKNRQEKTFLCKIPKSHCSFLSTNMKVFSNKDLFFKFLSTAASTIKLPLYLVVFKWFVVKTTVSEFDKTAENFLQICCDSFI